MNANTDDTLHSGTTASSSDPKGGRDPRAMNQAAIKARTILLADSPIPTEEELRPLVKELKGRLEFGLARKVLAKASKGPWDNKLSVWIVQQLALCTYKDEELLPSQRFSEALALLEQVGLCSADTVDPKQVDPSTLPETLGLGGGVYKRKWEYDGQIENLQQALVFYLAAWVAALAIPALKWLQPRNAMRGYAARAALALIGFVLCNLHLWTFDRMYLNRGKLKRLLHLQ